MSDKKHTYHKRLADWEPFDRITLEVIPRYKTSGMSGDEWRQHVAVKFWFKGVEVAEEGYRDMEAAIMFLGSCWHKLTCPILDGVIKLEDAGLCDQPSCKNPSVNRYRLKRETSDRGQYLDPSESEYLEGYRQFCGVHSRRGDCSREDADENYEVISGPGPDASSNVAESPSSFGGVIAIPET